jgi:hypothetical protein
MHVDGLALLLDFRLDLFGRSAIVQLLISNTEVGAPQVRHINSVAALCQILLGVKSSLVASFVVEFAIVCVANREINFSCWWFAFGRIRHSETALFWLNCAVFVKLLLGR